MTYIISCFTTPTMQMTMGQYFTVVGLMILPMVLALLVCGRQK